ncbi:DUF423 domain-containing protein [Luteimonas abyssi]|uniref:DUF423 domain-containing protein n=1 Tax=Luteimonas abyssi TaxID=1247514 RepID=UPI000737D1AB|nr:DUF423 domain-containing protein [Luteimonas abyssi]
MSHETSPGPGPAWLAAAGAVCAALGVGLSAYAAHAVDGPAQARLSLAALFAFGHGVALAALGARRRHTLAQVALCMLLLGMLLFSGSLAGAVLAGWGTRAAPWGGMLMMLGWLVLAFDFLRR